MTTLFYLYSNVASKMYDNIMEAEHCRIGGNKLYGRVAEANYYCYMDVYERLRKLMSLAEFDVRDTFNKIDDLVRDGKVMSKSERRNKARDVNRD